MNYSKGICWIDDCRIPFVDEKDPSAERYRYERNVDEMFDSSVGFKKTTNTENYKEQQGRFPANLLVSDDMLNDGSVSKSSGRKIYENDKKIDSNTYFLPENFNRSESNIKDKGSNSRYYDIDAWFDQLLEKLYLL